MATFYGQVKGSGKTNATRQGSKASHIASSAQSYDGSITVELYYNKDDELCIEVYAAEDSRFYGTTIYRGRFDQFANDCLAAYWS